MKIVDKRNLVTSYEVGMVIENKYGQFLVMKNGSQAYFLIDIKTWDVQTTEYPSLEKLYKDVHVDGEIVLNAELVIRGQL